MLRAKIAVVVSHDFAIFFSVTISSGCGKTQVMTESTGAFLGPSNLPRS